MSVGESHMACVDMAGVVWTWGHGYMGDGAMRTAQLLPVVLPLPARAARAVREMKQ